MSHTKPPYIAPVEIPATPAPTPQSEAVTALLSYSQADADGVMVNVSRQAIHMVVDELYAAKAEAERLREALGATQAKLDRLMLEFCPDEMTPEQLAEWGRHQAVAPETEALAATRKEDRDG